MNKRLSITICLLLVMVSLLFTMGCGRDDKYVKLVKSGAMDMVPNALIGKAFDKFFSDGKWKSFEATNGDRIVEFVGKCNWREKPATIKIQFLINDDKRFELYAVEVNNVPLNRIDSVGIMRKILSES